MSPTPPTLNPSQTVERIREIIVGRHLERLEGRIARLETAPDTVANAPVSDAPIFEDRLMIAEARVEALQEHVQRLETTSEEKERLAEMHRQDAQRLAAQINDIAREKAEATALPAVQKLENKLGAWLAEWQKSLHLRLENRDEKLLNQLKADLDELRSGVEKRFLEIEAKLPKNIEKRLQDLANAARVFADSAASAANPNCQEK
ncbi:hypothetical protein ACFSSA_04625 [Luteolibacter algae]|uniref:Uncharacterized protein n=1 Tax=Luteolibacter algae TaxID=454151 RepID=A0ABW5D4F9_9BACT